MTGFDLVFRAPRVVTAAGEVARCIAVRDGRVAAIEPLAADLPGEETISLADDEVLLPGLVDTHVHVNEPGRTEWEGFASATRAAAAGGITTIVDMPLNSVPPTVDVAALETKRKAAQGQVHVDVGFWGGAIPGNVGELRGLHDAGVFGFKCFLLHSGVDEFPQLSAAELDQYLEVLAGFPALLLVHAEDSQAVARAPAPHGERYADFLRSRPRGSENVAVADSSSACPRSGRRPGPGATAWSTWSAGWPSARPRWPAYAARATSPWAATPTSACSPPTRRSWSTPPGCTTATRSPLRWPPTGRGGPRHLAARPPDHRRRTPRNAAHQGRGMTRRGSGNPKGVPR